MYAFRTLKSFLFENTKDLECLAKIPLKSKAALYIQNKNITSFSKERRRSPKFFALKAFFLAKKRLSFQFSFTRKTLVF